MVAQQRLWTRKSHPSNSSFQISLCIAFNLMKKGRVQFMKNHESCVFCESVSILVIRILTLAVKI